MTKQPILIAVDGPAGAGKSEVSSRVAERLHILHLNTGAMYRAVAMAALRAGVNPRDAGAMDALCEKTRVDVCFTGGTQQTLLNGEDVSDRLRTPEVSEAASAVSLHAAVRRRMVDAQREIAKTQGMVLDGRDIGTRVLPHAACKIYLDASSAVRAQRRVAQYAAQGVTADIDQVRRDIEARDEQDMTRKTDPLRRAPDALYIDSSAMTICEVVQAVLHAAEAAYGN